mmetsp:Transcript_10518/g.34744  ORF Transcript_10518/g.34744 Transcript_10518/m.34744 type:complete len:346 (+) Transcript_10518:98-1135(+)
MACDRCGGEAKMRCSGCRIVLYCSRACQKAAWKAHKVECATEQALSTIVSRLEGTEAALPGDVSCYICLEGGKLVQGCACRGTSPGAFHLDCFEKERVAAEPPPSATRGAMNAADDRWFHCRVCQQEYRGVTAVEVARRYWRHFRRTDRRAVAWLQVGNCLTQRGFVDEAAQAFRLGADDPLVSAAGHRAFTQFLSELQRGREHTKRSDYRAALATFEPLVDAVDTVWRDPAISARYFSTVVNAMLASLAVHGLLGRSLDLTEQALQRVEDHVGKNTAEWINARRSRALALCEVGRLQDARAIVEHTLPISQRVLGSTNNELTIGLQHLLNDIHNAIRQQASTRK